MQCRGKIRNLIFLVLLSMISARCSQEIAHKGKVVFTKVPAKAIATDALDKTENKYAVGMQIVMAGFEKELVDEEVLTAGFSSARGPEISYDGKMMVFSAQKDEGSAWQIWTMNLENKEVFQVSESRTNCTDPVWLPNGDIAFSKLVTDEKSLKYHALFTIAPNGCCEQRITFQPHEDLNSSILHDGRILVASQQIYPEKGTTKLLALRPDGTKAELFYLATEKHSNFSQVIEDSRDQVLFNENGGLLSVDFSRPLHTKEVLVSSDISHFNSIYLMNDGQLLVSVKGPGEFAFGLGIVDQNKPLERVAYVNNAEFHFVEAVAVEAREVPRKLPSRVDPNQESGYFFCMDTDASVIQVNGEASKVQVLGISKMLGEATVEEDGSFYVELTADKPVRFQTVNDKDEILRGPSSWMWVRPNERRGCAGCHQDPEIAPFNVVPKAMKKSPKAILN